MVPTSLRAKEKTKKKYWLHSKKHKNDDRAATISNEHVDIKPSF